MSAFSLFSEGDFVAATRQDKIRHLAQAGENKQHNIIVTEYYQRGGTNPLLFLDKLGEIQEPSNICQYNQAVLAFSLQQYGRALKILKGLYNFLEGLDDYVGIKVCLLLAETYLAIGKQQRVPETLSHSHSIIVTSDIIRVIPDDEEAFFPPLLLAPWISDKPITVINRNEFLFISAILNCRVCLLNGDSDGARRFLHDAESEWSSISAEHYDPHIFDLMRQHKATIANYLNAHLAYNEGNMHRTMTLLLEIQGVEIHPSLKTGQLLALYNNLGCIHLRLQKPHLARLYLSKAMALVRNDQAVSFRNPAHAVTPHSSLRRVELLYNNALGFLSSYKPKQALDCLMEIAPMKHKSAIFWYRLAESYVQLYLNNLENGRMKMLSDICVEERNKLYLLPAKYIYSFQQEEFEPREDNYLEHAIRALRNALTLVTDLDTKKHILLLLSYVSLNSQPNTALVSALQLMQMDLSEQNRFSACMYAAEAYINIGKPKQALEMLDLNLKNMQIKCQSTLDKSSAVLTDMLDTKCVLLLNTASAHIHNGRLEEAEECLGQLLRRLDLAEPRVKEPSPGVPAPVLSLAIYLALKQGDHESASKILQTRNVWNFRTSG